MEKREKSSFTFLPRPSSFPPTPLFNEVLLYPAAFEALTCETESPLCFFPVHCTLKPPPNQIAHSCLVSNSVSQEMVNKPLPSPIPWQHAPFELVAVKCFFFSLPLSLPLTLFFLTGRSRAESQACMWHKTLNHHLPLSVNTVNVGLYSILYVLVCYSVECYSVVALSQPWRLTLFCISDFFHNVKFMVK